MKPETIDAIARHMAGIINVLEAERRRNEANDQRMERMRSRLAKLEKKEDPK